MLFIGERSGAGKTENVSCKIVADERKFQDSRKTRRSLSTSQTDSKRHDLTISISVTRVEL